MGPVEAFTTAWRKSFTYGGKATRVEYWWFFFINLVLYLALVLVVSGVAAGDPSTALIISPIVFIYAIAQVFPSLSITVRRLRDAGKEWTWIFINLIPLIGGIWFIYLLCQPNVHHE